MSGTREIPQQQHKVRERTGMESNGIGCKLTLVMVQAVVGGQDALQEGSRLGAGAGGVHAEQRLCCHLPAVPLLLLAGIHCNNPQRQSVL